MKYDEGQHVILLSIEGKPAAGSAVVVAVDEENGYYTVRHFLHDQSAGELIGRVPEGRIVSLHNIAV